VEPLKNNQEVEIYCPKCRPLVKLIVKTNRHNGNQFLGCPNYPDCDYTRPIPEEIRMRQAGQAELFDAAQWDDAERNPYPLNKKDLILPKLESEE
jgi:ssDNA-binding Zn-finger/Zn-ribbon topoisomerase 1